MMDKIKIMISSTVTDLLGERECIAELFSKTDFVDVIGAAPYTNTSISSSSAHNTIRMAKECDLFILILGNEYGFQLADGRSATQVEFDAAYHDDPTKILVFLKHSSSIIDPRQKVFIDKVCDYYSGYWRATFQHTYELQTIVQNSFLTWIKERASMGHCITYLDHFVRLAIQRKPEPNAEVYYSVKRDYIEIEYHYFGKMLTYHFAKEEVFNDFWGCLSRLDQSISP